METLLVAKRELAAQLIYRSGLLRPISWLPPSDSLLVLCYHRIGDSSQTMFDPAVYSATADEFHDQIKHLKRTTSLVTVDEALAFVNGDDKSKGSRCRVLITFDDGCIDNYSTAFPILHSLGAQGLFFLITGMAGTNTVPWWDRIAYILRTATRNLFNVDYPAALTIDMKQMGFNIALRSVLRWFKRPDNHNSEQFIVGLAESCGGQEPPSTSRIFLSWDEAREMLAGGMAIGSHTHTHTVLSQLSDVEQLQELTLSRNILSDALQMPIDTLAYPVGSVTAFTETTQLLAKQAGYRMAFSFHGGMNRPGSISQFNVSRQSVGDQSWNRFRAQVAICKQTGRFWP